MGGVRLAPAGPCAPGASRIGGRAKLEAAEFRLSVLRGFSLRDVRASGTPAAATVPEAVLDALTDAEGYVRIPFRVTGTREIPRIAPDAGTLVAQARQGGLRALAGQARDRWPGLFRKKE